MIQSYNTITVLFKSLSQHLETCSIIVLSIYEDMPDYYITPGPCMNERPQNEKSGESHEFEARHGPSSSKNIEQNELAIFNSPGIVFRQRVHDVSCLACQFPTLFGGTRTLCCNSESLLPEFPAFDA